MRFRRARNPVTTPFGSETVIDAVFHNEADASVTLGMPQQDDWGNPAEAASAFEGKLESYLGFVETGQLQEDFPRLAGLPVTILVWMQTEPPAGVRQLITAAQVWVPEQHPGVRVECREPGHVPGSAPIVEPAHPDRLGAER